MPESQAPTRILSEDEVRSDAQGSAWSDPPPADAERDPLLGTTLNQTYTLVRLLGTGGMGRVYEATHSRIKNKRYAIKVLHPELCFSSEVRSRFQREAEAAACVAHPNAVGIYDVALTSEGWPYLVCEFLEGKELAALLRSHGRLAPRQAVDIALQMCRVLTEAHKGGVVHRDLKPHNVFLVGDFENGMPERLLVKVLDFGLSRFLEGGTELTKTGAILGTPAYMAPEQARGERADHRTDVYGAGAVLYACVTGRSPFRGDTPQAVLISVMSHEPPRPSSLNPFISAELELVIQRAMAREPNDRYPSMDAMREALEALDAPLSQRREARGQRRMVSSAALDEAPASARFDLLLVLSLASSFAIVALVSAITGLAELWFGDWPLDSMETLLATLVVVGTLLTPAILLLYRLRAKVWGNTARVVEFLLSARRALITSLLTYGTLAILLLFWDHAGRRLFGEQLPLGDATLSWSGLPATLLVSASFMIAAELLHGKLTAQGGWVSKMGSEATERRRRWIAGPGLFSAGVLVATMTVVTLLASRSKAPDTGVRSAVAAGPDAAKPTTAKALASAKKKVPASPMKEPVPPTAAADPPRDARTEPQLASASDLRSATSQGADALVALFQRHPEDPRVARALGVHYAASAATLPQSLNTFSKLFKLDPKAAEDKDVRQLVLQMTEIGGPVQQHAFELLAFEMGHEGTDQLYRMALTEPKRKDQALRHLKMAGERGTVSEALRIAMDLQYDSSCENRVTLLPRAVEHGDERSVQILAALSTAKRGCGRRKRELCKPTCPAQAEQFRETVEAISTRLAK